MAQQKVSWEVTVVRQAAKKLINDAIGYRENTWLDDPKEFSKLYQNNDAVEIINEIVSDMMSSNQLSLEDSNLIITKEVRFLGKQKVTEIVASLILRDYMNDKWSFPHTFNADKVLEISKIMKGGN